MIRILLTLALLISLPCCARDYAPTQPMPATHSGQRVIINSFANETETYVDWGGIRVDGYCDLSSYDSLVVTFRAAGGPGTATPALMSLKIGPTWCAAFTITGEEQAYECHVQVCHVVKCRSAQFTFYMQDTAATARIGDLLVVGWFTC